MPPTFSGPTDHKLPLISTATRSEEVTVAVWKQRKRLGLALSGGVARGRAHVGVIEGLHQAGIHADFVSGVSAGALVAAAYAAGVSVAGLRDLAVQLTWPRIAAPILPLPGRRGARRLGLVDFSKIEPFLIRTMGDPTFDELPIPLAIGATDLVTGEPVVITDGRVVHAARASASVPGIVAPARWRGRLLCDGFASNNLLIGVLREMGADVVVAVNIMPLGHRVPSNLFWAGSAALSALVLKAGDALDQADFLIEPDLAESDYLFPRTEDMLARGRAAVAPVIAPLKALLG
ncbi:MAG: patatin-like phospholipase family protein [Caldilineales bacterium]